MRKVLWTFLCELFNQGLQSCIRGFVRNSRLQPEPHVEGAGRVLGDFQGQVGITVVPREPRRCHSHDGVILPYQLQSLPQDGRIRIEVSLPELEAQHHDRLWILTIHRVSGNQSPPQQCRHSKVVEPV